MPTLNDKVIAYLTVNNITYNIGDYTTGIPADSNTDQIVYWDTAALGPQPTQAQLDTVYPLWEGQQIAEQNKTQATTLLQETDWTATVDINNPQYSNPYLGNQDAFLTYRSQVRQIAVNPPTTPSTFPQQPNAVWVAV